MVREFVPLVDFLGAALGQNTEVVLHDVTDVDSSVIAIANGHISGRDVGSPATNLMLRVLREGSSGDEPFITNYPGRTKRSARPLRSATYFIREEGRIVGMLCLNTDQSAIHALVTAADELREQAFSAAPGVGEERTEQLFGTVTDMAAAAVSDYLDRVLCPVEDLTPAQRTDIVRELDESGFFQLKNGVATLASHLGVSEPTVYRYLQTVRTSTGKP